MIGRSADMCIGKMHAVEKTVQADLFR